MNEKIGGEAQGFRACYFVSGIYEEHPSEIVSSKWHGSGLTKMPGQRIEI